MLGAATTYLAAFALNFGGFAQGKVDGPDNLARVGAWVMNYDRDSCQLMSEFGTGNDLVVLRLTRYEPGDFFELGLYGNRMKTRDARTSGTVDFGLGAKATASLVETGKAAKFDAMYFSRLRFDGWDPYASAAMARSKWVPLMTPAQEAAVHGATIEIAGKRSFHLEFGSLAKPMAQMRDCTANLVKSWGYDPQVRDTLRSQPIPLTAIADWLRPSDYPDKALRGGHNGTVQYRLDVDPAGNVAGCYVLSRTSPDDFADTTCRMVSRRAKFMPAVDHDGNPVRSFFVHRVNWMIP